MVNHVAVFSTARWGEKRSVLLFENGNYQEFNAADVVDVLGAAIATAGTDLIVVTRDPDFRADAIREVLPAVFVTPPYDSFTERLYLQARQRALDNAPVPEALTIGAAWVARSKAATVWAWATARDGFETGSVRKDESLPPVAVATAKALAAHLSDSPRPLVVVTPQPVARFFTPPLTAKGSLTRLMGFKAVQRLEASHESISFKVGNRSNTDTAFVLARQLAKHAAWNRQRKVDRAVSLNEEALMVQRLRANLQQSS